VENSIILISFEIIVRSSFQTDEYEEDEKSSGSEQPELE